MKRRAQLRRRHRGRRTEWIVAGCVVAAAALLAPSLGKLLAGDRPGPEATRGGAPVPLALQTIATHRAAIEPGKLPVFARLRPDLVADTAPTTAPSSIPAELEASLSAPAPVRRGTDLRVLESALDPGLNTRKLARPGEVPLPEKEAEELRQRMRPGFTAPAPYKVPFVHTDVIAPHLTPDVEVAVSDSTKLGVFGQVRPAGDGKVPFPGIINRPLGAGVTLEYRFGTK